MNGHGLRLTIKRTPMCGMVLGIAASVAEHDTERVKRSNDKMSTKRALSPILEDISVTVSVTGGSLWGQCG